MRDARWLRIVVLLAVVPAAAVLGWLVGGWVAHLLCAEEHDGLFYAFECLEEWLFGSIVGALAGGAVGALALRRMTIRGVSNARRARPRI